LPQVRDVEERVRRCLDPQQPRAAAARRERRLDGRAVGEVDELDARAAALREHRELPERAVIAFLGRHEQIARAEELEHCHVGRQPRGEGCRAGSTLEARHARFQRRTVRGALAAVAVASRVVPIHVALEGRAEEDRLGHGARRRVGRVRGVDTERVETRRLAHTLSRPSSRRSAARSDSAPLTLHYGFADSLRRRAMEVSHGARAQHVAGSQV